MHECVYSQLPCIFSLVWVSITRLACVALYNFLIKAIRHKKSTAGVQFPGGCGFVCLCPSQVRVLLWAGSGLYVNGRALLLTSCQLGCPLGDAKNAVGTVVRNRLIVHGPYVVFPNEKNIY